MIVDESSSQSECRLCTEMNLSSRLASVAGILFQGDQLAYDDH